MIVHLERFFGHFFPGESFDVFETVFDELIADGLVENGSVELFGYIRGVAWVEEDGGGVFGIVATNLREA